MRSIILLIIIIVIVVLLTLFEKPPDDQYYRQQEQLELTEKGDHLKRKQKTSELSFADSDLEFLRHAYGVGLP